MNVNKLLLCCLCVHPCAFQQLTPDRHEAVPQLSSHVIRVVAGGLGSWWAAHVSLHTGSHRDGCGPAPPMPPVRTQPGSEGAANSDIRCATLGPADCTAPCAAPPPPSRKHHALSCAVLAADLCGLEELCRVRVLGLLVADGSRWGRHHLRQRHDGARCTGLQGLRTALSMDETAWQACSLCWRRSPGFTHVRASGTSVRTEKLSPQIERAQTKLSDDHGFVHAAARVRVVVRYITAVTDDTTSMAQSIAVLVVLYHSILNCLG